MPHRISAQHLISLTGSGRFPHVIDVRRHDVFASAGKRVAGAVWRDHMKTSEWAPELSDGRQVVVYCAHGHNVSEIAAARTGKNHPRSPRCSIVSPRSPPRL